MEKTIGECLRNNWNSLNDANPEERRLRIKIQNDFSCGGEFDLDFYLKYLWNEKKEDKK